ncbi:MAG TPA: hypothetical protein VEH01_02780 [Nitrososphaerales archaeon]|nr:hypothetical protein [Nitrososphaerales archaeon]
MNDAVLFMGPSEVESIPSAVVAPLTPSEKVELEEEVEVLETDETVETDDELVLAEVVVAVDVAGVVTVLTPV